MDKYNFSDELISHIAQSIQMAILSGTDIVDHLRQVEVTPLKDSKLVLTDDFQDQAKNSIEKMLERATVLQQGE